MAHCRSPRRFIASAALVTLTALPAAGRAQSTASVSGLVRSTDGQPVENARVRAEQPGVTAATFSDSTDEHGRFSMIGLTRGTWTFIAEADGYVSQERRLAIRTLGRNPMILFTLGEGVPEVATAGLGEDEVRQLQADLAEADRLRSDGDQSGAIELYRDLLTRLPSLSAVHFEIGRAERELGAFERARVAFREILAADPDNRQARVELGITELMAGAPLAARTVLEPLSAEPVDDRDVSYYLGEAAFRLQEMETAADWYRRAAAADPSWTEPLLKLGLIALTGGNTTGAATHLQRVLELDPGSPDADQAEEMLRQIGALRSSATPD